MIVQNCAFHRNPKGTEYELKCPTLELLMSNSIQFSRYKGYIKLKNQNQCILCTGTMKIYKQCVGISCRFFYEKKVPTVMLD